MHPPKIRQSIKLALKAIKARDGLAQHTKTAADKVRSMPAPTPRSAIQRIDHNSK